MKVKEWTAKELKNAVEFYFADCEKLDVFPDPEGLLLWLEIDEQRYEELCEKEQLKAVFDYAARKRRSCLWRTMISSPKMAAGCKMALAQDENGSYGDKPTVNRDKKTIIEAPEQLKGLFK